MRLLCLMLVSLVMSGCGHSLRRDDVLGSWELVNVEDFRPPPEVRGFLRFEFGSDSVLIHKSQFPSRLKGSWTLRDSILELVTKAHLGGYDTVRFTVCSVTSDVMSLQRVEKPDTVPLYRFKRAMLP